MNHLCVCADGNYINYVAALFESISKYHKGDLVFHLITDAEPLSVIKDSISLAAQLNTFKYHVLDAEEFTAYKECAHFTKAMYYRFKIPELLPECKFALYMDCDMLVRGSLVDLFSGLNTKTGLYACRNPFFNRKKELNLQGGKYFNSGLMLINCDYWRENNVFDQLIFLLESRNEVLKMPDQDALNIYFDDQWGELSPKYNAQTSILMRPKAAIKEYRGFIDALVDPVVVHFSSPNKQWHLSSTGKYVAEYRALEFSSVSFRKGRFRDMLIRLKYLLTKIVSRCGYK